MKSFCDRLKAVVNDVARMEQQGKTRKARKILDGVHKSYAADNREISKQEGRPYKLYVKQLNKKRKGGGKPCSKPTLRSRLFKLLKH